MSANAEKNAPNRVQGMVRSMDQWRNMVPAAVAAGSVAQIEYALIDAKTDIEALWSKLEQLVEALDSIVIETGGKAIPNESLTACRNRALAALGRAPAPQGKGRD